EFLPNEKAIARLQLETPISALIGDRFILRDPSERQTVAGGIVLDPLPRRNKLREEAQRALLDARASSPNDLRVLLRAQLERDKFAARRGLLPNAPFSAAEIATCLEQLGISRQIFLDEKIAAAAGWWNELKHSAAQLIDTEHRLHPEKQ